MQGQDYVRTCHLRRARKKNRKIIYLSLRTKTNTGVHLVGASEQKRKRIKKFNFKISRYLNCIHLISIDQYYNTDLYNGNVHHKWSMLKV